MLNLALRVCERRKISTEHVCNREVFSSSVNNFEMSKFCENHLSFILSWGEITFAGEKKRSGL